MLKYLAIFIKVSYNQNKSGERWGQVAQCGFHLAKASEGMAYVDWGVPT